MSVTPPTEDSLHPLEYSREWTDPDAFPSLSYARDWTIPEDFPTIETDEATVRADMQALYNEIKDYVNCTPGSAWENTGLRQYVVATGNYEAAVEDAEADRVAAEAERVLAEEGRVSAEEGRVSAENARNVWENYNDLKTYVPGNKVYYQGSSYVCIVTATSILPTNTSYWQIVAKQGESDVAEHNVDPDAHANLYIRAGRKDGTTLGRYATAEGNQTTASGNSAHAEGAGTITSGTAAHAEGWDTEATGAAAHAEGHGTVAARRSQHVFGEYNVAESGSGSTPGSYVEIVGNGMADNARSNARTLDWDGNEVLAGSLTLGGASGATIKKGTGSGSLVTGNTVYNKASARCAFVEGGGDSVNPAYTANEASGANSHAEGRRTIASSNCSHAEGSDATASGDCSHAEGRGTIASGYDSHAEGSGTTANHASQHVFGEWNIADANAAGVSSRGDYVEVVGNGTADSARSNARTLDWDGNEWLAGKLTMEGTPTADKDAATKKYVDDAAAALVPLVGKGVNLLDNAYFIGGGGAGKLPINQRGQTSYSGEGYGIDRWYFSNARSSMALNGGSIQITRTVAGSSIQLRQLFERPVSGSQFTFSALCTGRLTQGAASIALLDESGDTISGAYVGVNADLLPDGDLADAYLLTATYSGPSAVSGLTIAMSSNTAADDYIKLFAVKLELGSRQTLARQVNGAWVLNDPPPDYGEELAKCQRYLQIMRGGENAFVLGPGFMNTATEARFTVPLSVPMAAINQIVEDSSFVFNVGGTWVTTGISSIHIINQQDNGLYMSAAFSSAMTANAIVVACLSFSKTLLFSAE